MEETKLKFLAVFFICIGIAKIIIALIKNKDGK